MNTKSVRTRLLTTTATTAVALASLFAMPAQAQDTSSEVSELVVTGSRIPRPNLEQPTPVGVLKVEDQLAPLALGDMLARLPQVSFNGTLRSNSNNFGTTAGISAANLRNLGVSRTLVLVDGQRHVAGDLSTNAVDLNSIPTALVDRVEVITGGASAVYGSDAVTGVVNIITKKRFEGLQVDATGGGYDGFGGRYSASITGGRNFLDDRLNVTVSGFWRKEQAIDASDIASANNYGTILNPADLALGARDPSFFTGFRASGPTTPNNGIPDRLFVPNVGTELTTTNGVLVNAGTGSAIVFNAAGQPIAAPRRTGYNSFAYGQLPADCAVCFFPEDYKEVSSKIETGGFAFKTSYDLTSKVRAFVDAKYVENNAENNIQPSFTAGDFLLMPDNAFLTPAIGQAVAQDGGQFYVISRWLNGGRSQDIRRRTYRMVGGLEGDWDADFATVKWNATLNYGETGTRIRYNDLLINENFAAALDSVIDPATGRAACRINVPSAGTSPFGYGAGAANRSACVPYNPFGDQNSAAAMAYSFGDFTGKDRLTQQVASVNARFDTGKFLNLQGGPVGVAVGGEYRMERTHSRSDALLTSGGADFTATDSAGGFNVVEGYVELSAPLFRDAGPLMHELTIDGAFRGADYSTVGKVAAYKVGAVYGPTNWLKFRGGWSRSVRAPNIVEAYAPVTSAFFPIADPCSAENVGTNVNYARNCAAAGIPAGFTATTNALVAGTSSGNANLDPEKSKSYTLGFVVQPPMVRGLAITLDYYSISIKDAITQVAAQDIIDNCYGSNAGLDATYCSLFSRTGGPRFALTGVQTTYVNASKLFTDGFELQLNYAADVGELTQNWGAASALDGQLNFHLTADYVVSLRNYPFQDNPGDVNKLEGTANPLFGNNPQLKAVADLAYSQGPVTVQWATRYIGRQALFSRDPSATQGSESLNVPFTEPTFYHDLKVTYRFDGTAKGLEVYAGAQNIFDEQPPFTVLGSNRDAAFDLGRFLFVGARFKR